MRRAAVLLLLVFATQGSALPGRPGSDLRFDDVLGAGATTFRIASDGTDFLLLRGQAEAYVYGEYRLYTQKVVDGRAVGPHHQIANGEPAGLAWTGTDYLAGWRNDDGLWVAPVSRDGTLRTIPAEPVLAHRNSHLAIGNHAALAFGYTQNKFVARPLDLTGRPKGPAVLHTAPATGAQVSVGVTPAGFAAVFTGRHGSWAMLFRADGTALLPAPILLDGPYGQSANDYRSKASAIATDGTDTLIVFGLAKAGTAAEIRSAVIAADGRVKSHAVLYSNEGWDNNGIAPTAVMWDGAQYVALAHVTDEFRGVEVKPILMRVGRDGQRLGDLAPITVGDAIPGVYGIGWNGRQFLLPIVPGAAPRTAIHSILLDPATMRASAPAPLGQTLTAQSNVAIEGGAGGYLSAWSEEAAGVTTIRASRIDAAGNYLDGEGIVLGRASVPDYVQRIAIDGSGPQWFVLWSDRYSIRGVGISRNGVPARGGAMTIGSGLEADVRWNGSRYIVLTTDGSLRKSVLTGQGKVVETTTLLETERVEVPGTDEAFISYWEPSIVMLQGRPLAIFLRHLDGCSIGTPGGCWRKTTVMGLRLDDAAATPFTIAEGFGIGRGFDVVSDSARAFVVWTQYEQYAPAVFGSFISADAQAGTPFVIGSGDMPSVHFDRQDFVVSWAERDRIAIRRVSGEVPQTDVQHVAVEDTYPYDVAIAASPTLPALMVFVDRRRAYDGVPRAELLFANEFDPPATAPPAPTILCATKNTDDTITVRWEPVPNSLGVSIELRLPDGTFRPIGVAAAGATSARVPVARREGSVVRVRAWNLAGVSDPSAIAPSSPAPMAILGSSIQACAGTPVEIDVTLVGTAPFTIRWSDGVVQSNLPRFATRVFNATRNTTLSIVSVADASCSMDDTRHMIEISVDRPVAIVEQTREARISRNGAATLSIRATDATQIAWFEGNPGDTSTAVGTSSPTFTTPALTKSTRYWARVSNRCGSVDSAPIDVTVTGKTRAVR